MQDDISNNYKRSPPALALGADQDGDGKASVSKKEKQRLAAQEKLKKEQAAKDGANKTVLVGACEFFAKKGWCGTRKIRW